MPLRRPPRRIHRQDTSIRHPAPFHTNSCSRKSTLLTADHPDGADGANPLAALRLEPRNTRKARNGGGWPTERAESTEHSPLPGRRDLNPALGELRVHARSTLARIPDLSALVPAFPAFPAPPPPKFTPTERRAAVGSTTGGARPSLGLCEFHVRDPDVLPPHPRRQPATARIAPRAVRPLVQGHGAHGLRPPVMDHRR